MSENEGATPSSQGSAKEIRALCMAGSGRQGSTLISSALGGIESWFNAGELMEIWRQRRPGSTRLCGCGSPLTECGFWMAVEDLAPEAVHLDEEASSLVMATRATHRWPALLRAAGRPDGPFMRWSRAMGELYRAIAEVSGADVVVDTSKLPNSVLASTQQGAVDVSIIQLVRDPVAVVASWKAPKEVDGRPGEGLFAMRPSRATYDWITQAAATERILAKRVPEGRFELLRYEDFVAAPAAQVRRIADWMGSGLSESPFVDERTFRTGESHVFAGNPGRHAAGNLVRVEAGTKRSDRLNASEVAVIKMVTGLRARRYGYR